MLMLLILAVLAAIAVGATIWAVARDGYRAVHERECYDTRRPFP